MGGEILGFPESSTPPHEVPTAKKKRKMIPLNRSEFQGYLYLTDVGDPTNEWTGELSNDNFPESVVSFDQGSAVEKHSDTSEDLHVENVVVAPRENGGYVVSGTRYYVDNRANGDVRGKPDVMRDEYRLRSASKEYSEMIKDPRFAVEVELSKMMKRRSRRRFLQKGTKTQRFEESGKKTQKQRSFFDPEPPSVAWMMQKGGRLFEKRSTNIGGKLVTVEIGNKNLHGVDLIVRPGSIVHEAMPVKQDMNAIQKRMISNKNGISNMDGEALSPSNDYIKDTNLLETRAVPKETILEGDAQSVNACFQRQPDAHLSGFPAFKTAVGFTEIECLALCARSTR
ncbi:hypothetical protein NECAME_03454 [Necator americanus]|uniref:Uncharacterized protein n=1 Tax=Necator americanus TaxID=51031 RepID=W2T6B5_NECAM|nr:hypothetical protein NECAME_03454 [Necator americanus]ETN76522.1 hypothetical protein NECAME_03454 [Necator americanus]